MLDQARMTPEVRIVCTYPWFCNISVMWNIRWTEEIPGSVSMLAHLVSDFCQLGQNLISVIFAPAKQSWEKVSITLVSVLVSMSVPWKFWPSHCDTILYLELSSPVFVITCEWKFSDELLLTLANYGVIMVWLPIFLRWYAQRSFILVLMKLRGVPATGCHFL